jgi:hypothetical protein
VLRRYAKFLNEKTAGCGGVDHQTLDIFGGDIPLVTENLGYDTGNEGPTTDFFRALKSGDYSDVLAPVYDQSIAIKLLAAAYKCMVKRLQGDISPVILGFGENEWRMPPGR